MKTFEQCIKAFVWGLLFVAPSAHASGFYELDYDWNSGSKAVATITVGSLSERLSSLIVVDSTQYYEAFIGRPFTLGQIAFVPHIGLEGLKGVNPRPRGFLLTSAQFGPATFVVVNEFGGVTGNFHKERVQFDIGKFGLGAVNHRFAGFGPRIDYKLSPRSALYLQYLQKGGASRLTLALTGEF